MEYTTLFGTVRTTGLVSAPIKLPPHQVFSDMPSNFSLTRLDSKLVWCSLLSVRSGSSSPVICHPCPRWRPHCPRSSARSTDPLRSPQSRDGQHHPVCDESTIFVVRVSWNIPKWLVEEVVSICRVPIQEYKQSDRSIQQISSLTL